MVALWYSHWNIDCDYDVNRFFDFVEGSDRKSSGGVEI